MQNKNILEFEIYTLNELANIWPLTVDQIHKIACEEKIKIGILSNGWVIRPANRVQAHIHYGATPKVSITKTAKNGSLPSSSDKISDQKASLPKVQEIIQEPFAFMKEDLVTLRDTGSVTVFFVMAFDKNKYFQLLYRGGNDIRYRIDQISFPIRLSTNDRPNLIVTRFEKERFEREYGIDPISEEYKKGQLKQKNELATLGLAAYAISELNKAYKGPNGANKSQIAKLFEEKIEAFCKSQNIDVPRGFKESVIEKRLADGIEQLQEIIKNTNLC